MKTEQHARRLKYAGIVRLGLIVLGVVLGVVISALVPAPKTSHGSTDDATAYIMAKKFIQKRLVAPSTAEFPSQVWNGGEVQVVKLASGGYRVSAWLDAENSFGTKLRCKWACELKRTSDGVWEVTGFCDLIE